MILFSLFGSNELYDIISFRSSCDLYKFFLSELTDAINFFVYYDNVIQKKKEISEDNFQKVYDEKHLNEILYSN